MASKYKDGIKDGINIAIEGSLTIALAIPLASNIVITIDRIAGLIQKAMSNKALCTIIGDHLNHTKSMLVNSHARTGLDQEAFERYLEVLNDVEERINVITGNKKRIKIWLAAKNFTCSRELEQELIQLYKRLNLANNELSLSIMMDTHQGVMKIQEDVKGVKQLEKDVKILAMNLDMDDWRKDDIMLKNQKVTELRNQPRVIRGKTVKKKYLTQDVAQTPLNPGDNMDNMARKIISMLKLLDSCENVIKLFGIYKSSGILYLITEWCEHGNLEEYLLRNPNMDWNIKVNIATDIANGLVFCHDRDILHHDIKSSNILLDAHLCAKISNFKMSRKETDVTNRRNPSAEDARYMAPEKLNNSECSYSKECDIYSFGIVLWVIAVQERPYANMTNLLEISNHVIKGNRPEPVDECIPNKYTEIMKKAWDQNDYNRMRANEIYDKLSKCLADDVLTPSTSSTGETSIMNKPDEHRAADEKYKQAVRNHRAQKYKEAWPIFCDLASINYKDSTFYLGHYYDKGYYVPQSNKNALKYYRESADANCGIAAYFYAEVCQNLAHEYMDKAAQLRHFKSGIKLAEWKLPELQTLSSKKKEKDEELQDSCNKLLSYLDADKTKLQEQQNKNKIKQEDFEAFMKRIDKLQTTLNQLLTLPTN